MATDHRIGRTYVEVGMDYTPFDRSSRLLKKDATQVSLNIEKNFKNLGIRSAKEFDLMRAKVINSYNMIAASGKATANDLIRIEQAKVAKLKQINDMQYGHTVSMFDELKKNWVATTVAMTGAYFAALKAWDLAAMSTQYQQSAQAFRSMVQSMGKDANIEFAKIKEASANLIDTKSLTESANKAISLGIPIDRLGELMEIARAKARDMGISTTQAFNDIATGVGRASPLILDNLGLAIKVGSANENLAASLGKTVKELTDKEKKTAILNATIDAGKEALDRYDLSVKTTKERMDSLIAQKEDLKLLFGQVIIRGATAAAAGFNYLAAGVLGLVSAYAKYRSLVYKIIGDEQKAQDNMTYSNAAWDARNALIEESKEYWDLATASEKELNAATVVNTKRTIENISAKADLGDALDKIIEKEESLAESQLQTYDSLKKFLELNSQIDEHATAVVRLEQQYSEMEDKLKALELAGYDVSEMWTLMGQWHEAAMNKIDDKTEDTTNKFGELWEHAFERIQDMTADWLRDFEFSMDSLLDLFKDTMAQMAAYWVWGDQSKGFSYANMFGGSNGGGGWFSNMFVGGSTSGNQSNGVGNVVQGASSAYSLSQAYSAYTTAGGGWGGVQAGASSFFGDGGASGSTPLTAYLAGAYYLYSLLDSGVQNAQDARKNPFSSEWERGDVSSGFENVMEGLIHGNTFENWLGIDLFGFMKNKKRSYYGETYGFQDYSPDEGWGASTFGQTWTDRRDGEEAFGEAGQGMAETAQSLMNSLDTMFKGLLGTFDDTKVVEFTTAMAMLSAEMVPVTEATKGYYKLLEQGITEVPRMSFGYYISAEDEDEFKDDWRESWARMTANIIDPIVAIGTDLLSEALDSTVTNNTAWNYFTDDMQDYLKDGLEGALEGLQVDWSAVTDQESFEAAFEQMELAANDIAIVLDYITQVAEVMAGITNAIDMHGYSDSIQSAATELDTINAEFATLGDTLESLGVDLEKYTDLQIAYDLAIQDWIQSAFVGAISYASTSQGWRQMAGGSKSSSDLMWEQQQHVKWLTEGYDGTTVSAIQLSDAMGVLSGMSYDLAAEIQGAIDSIHASYTSAIESMYLETLSDQSKYDYYKTQAESSYSSMMSATSGEDIEQYAQDYLQYVQSAYSMLSDDQKQQYFSDYQSALLQAETASTDRLDALGDAMDTANEKLIIAATDIMVAAVDIVVAAANIKAGGEAVATGGAYILEASQTPLMVDVNYDAGEVG